MMGVEEVPTVSDRVLTEEGYAVMRLISKRQKAHLPTYLRDINKMFNGHYRRQAHPSTQALEIFGYIELVKRAEVAGLGQNKGYRLTDKGWEALGEKPLWL